MKNIIFLIIGCVVGCVAVTVFFTYNINKESTTAIDAEILQYENKISLLDSEISKYSGGLYPALLSVQKAIYGDTVAALKMKRSQLAHWIVMRYTAKATTQLPTGKMENYQQEIAFLEAKIKNDKAESARYNPCLVKSLIDARIAQEELTVAGLERAMIAQKYGIPFLILPDEKQKKPTVKPPVVQSPQQDKEAL